MSEETSTDRFIRRTRERQAKNWLQDRGIALVYWGDQRYTKDPIILANIIRRAEGLEEM